MHEPVGQPVPVPQAPRQIHIRVFKSGRYWAIEVPILTVVSQGRTKKEAFEMIADAIETLVGKPGFKIHQKARLETGRPNHKTAIMLQS
jgi:predicted RNase H-like HicB family nuclease